MRQVVFERVFDVPALEEDLVGAPAVIDIVAEQPVDQIGDVLVFREEDVAADRRSRSRPSRTSGRAPRSRVLFQHFARVPEKSLQGEPADAAAENADVHESHLMPAFKKTAR